jgi:hypothetical protein
MRNRSLHGLGWVAALLIGGLSCTKTTDAPGGTNTNWLECKVEADCDPGMSCRDGKCVPDSAPNASLDAAVPQPDATAGANAGTGGSPSTPAMDAGPDAGRDGSMPEPSYTLERNSDRQVEIGSSYTGACTRDDDCTLVGTGCDGCCQMGAIRADLVDTYQVNFVAACKGYQGPVCTCPMPPLVARCQDNVCRAVEMDSADDCFSPTQNFDLANADGAGLPVRHARHARVQR